MANIEILRRNSPPVLPVYTGSLFYFVIKSQNIEKELSLRFTICFI